MVEHASNQTNLDNLDTYYARKSGPLSPEQRLKKQIRFLNAFSKTGNVMHSCKFAGINRQTFYDWRDNDPVFAFHLENYAREDAIDNLEYAAYDRAVTGIPSYVVSHGRIVYEDVPDLDGNGKPKLDKNGEIITKRGKPLIERKYSDALHIALLKANRPEKYNVERHEHTGPDGKAIQLEIVNKLASLPPTELDLLEQASRIVDEAVKHGS